MEHDKRAAGRKEKKRRGGKGTVLAGAALALVLLGGAGLGLGNGLGRGEAVPAMAPSASDVPNIEEKPTAEPREEESRVIEVREAEILHGGDVLDLSALRERLLTLHQEGDVWMIVDAHAKKAPYDQVRALLQELGLSFQEEIAP